MRLLNENGVCLLTDVSTQLGQIKKVHEIALYEAQFKLNGEHRNEQKLKWKGMENKHRKFIFIAL